ncbi:MAG: hypothetical protein U1F51_06465 [Burkholderiales bacterium]
MHRHAAIVLLLASNLLGVPCARAGPTIVIGPQPMAAADSASSTKLGEATSGFDLSACCPYATQAFAKAAARNLGPQRSDQRLAFAVNTFTPASTIPGSELLTIADLDFRADSPTLNRWVINDPVSTGPMNLTGMQLGGERLFVGANVSTGPNAFHPWLYSFALPRSGGLPTLRASLDLAPGFAGTAEVTDVRFVTPPTSDLADLTSNFFLVAEQQSGDCHAIKFGKAEYVDDGTPSLSQKYHFGAFQPFSECHTRAMRFGKNDPLPADAAIWIGGRVRNTPNSSESVALYKLTDQGDTAVLDTSFGGDGQVKIQHASGLNMRFFDLTSRTDRLYVALAVEGPQVGTYQPIIMRMFLDGGLDYGFGVNGIVLIPATGSSSNPRTITTDAAGNIVVTGETYTANSVRPFAYFHVRTSPLNAAEAFASQHVEYAFPGFANSAFFTHDHAPDGTITFGGATYGAYPDISTMRPFVGRIAGPPGTTKAIEYFHAGLGHYAVISIPAEIQALDSQTIPGWTRTGFWFNVHATEAPGTLGVDRFFSDAFAPKSSHFYTNNANEFAILQGSPVWKHEGRTFFAYWPALDNRCPPGMRPVKRIFNNGVTGAPNHQYADDEDVINQAIARGGVIETGAADGAFFCSR